MIAPVGETVIAACVEPLLTAHVVPAVVGSCWIDVPPGVITRLTGAVEAGIVAGVGVMAGGVAGATGVTGEVGVDGMVNTGGGALFTVELCTKVTLRRRRYWLGSCNPNPCSAKTPMARPTVVVSVEPISIGSERVSGFRVVASILGVTYSMSERWSTGSALKVTDVTPGATETV